MSYLISSAFQQFNQGTYMHTVTQERRLRHWNVSEYHRKTQQLDRLKEQWQERITKITYVPDSDRLETPNGDD